LRDWCSLANAGERTYFLLRWIDPARVPWVATKYPANAFPGSNEHSVLAQGLDEVLAACRMKTAVGADHGADQPLITSNQDDEYPAKDPAGKSDSTLQGVHGEARLGTELLRRSFV
jgi:hypothetical protein